MTDQQEFELHIPSVQPGVDLVGILHRKPSASPGKRRIALILHGLLAHKNQCYHRALAESLPIDSYRFDFRGNGDSKGDWAMGTIDNDVEDLASVVRHLCQQEGYAVDLIVAHSRGTMVSWMYLSRGEQVLLRDGGSAYLPNLVVVSGRWAMEGMLKTYARFQQGFDKEGFYRWHVTVAGKKREYIVWPKDLEMMAHVKTPQPYVEKLSTNTDVLVVHGTADRTVPSHDAQQFIRVLEANPSRRNGSHRLEMVEGADHMYRGKTEAVVELVCKWYADKSGGLGKGGRDAGKATSTSRL